MQNNIWAQDSYLAWFCMVADAGTTFFAPKTPAVPVEAGQLQGESHEGHRLYIPKSAPHCRAPLVVMLHGAGQSPEDFAAGTAMNAAAQRHGFIVLYPGQSTRANAYRCWNWFEPAHQTRKEGEPALLAALTLRVARKHRVDTRRIYVAGLSAGGAMAALLGDLFPDIYAGVGVHSGLAARAGCSLSSALGAMRRGAREGGPPSGMPTIVFHGDRDDTVSAVNGDHVIEASVGADCSYESTEHVGADGRRFTRRRYTRDTAEVCGEHWALHDGMHAWSGGNRNGSFADPLGPDASEEMLRFFDDLGRRERLPAS